MKKVISVITLALFTIPALAQEAINYDPLHDKEFLEKLFQVISIIFVIYLIANAILTLIKMFLDYKLKNKMMDKGASETIVQQLLQPQKTDAKTTAIKWAIIVGGMGLGFSLMLLFPPFGIHSVMIMAFCVSLSFLCFYYFIRKTDA
jgi:hypothetical protein